MSSPFKFYNKLNEAENLVLFVHGFTGGHETWARDSETTYPELLIEDSFIKESIDIASYEYFTKLTDVGKTFSRIRSLFTKGLKKNQSNLGIEELANNLRDHIRFSLSQYNNIYIIAHSMGGLIAKSLILNDISKSGETKIKLLISLAVPHQGAELSVLGGMLSSNIQIKDLNSVQPFITQLNENWLKLDNKPAIKYIYGSHDTVVTPSSAQSIDIDEKDIVSVSEDHLSISKPENQEAVVVKASIEFIKDTHANAKVESAGYQKLEKEGLFDDELFVLKLIVANIEDDTKQDAKELFLNAEYVSKTLKSKHDRKKLEELFANINQIYRDSYNKYLHSDDINSGLLLSEVHEKITNEDSKLLKSLIPCLKVFHKKGMLHQMANDEDYQIWWNKEKSLSGLEES